MKIRVTPQEADMVLEARLVFQDRMWALAEALYDKDEARVAPARDHMMRAYSDYRKLLAGLQLENASLNSDS